jgi:hypothetical protein
MANRPLTTRSLRPIKLSAVTPTLTLRLFGRMVLRLYKVDCCWPDGTASCWSSSIAGTVDGMVHRWKAEWSMGCVHVYKASLIATNVQPQPAQHPALHLRTISFTLDQSHLLHTDNFSRRCFYPQKSWHSPAYLCQRSSRHVTSNQPTGRHS